MTDQARTPPERERVTSESPAANELIGSLRGVAKGILDLGNANVALEVTVGELQQEAHTVRTEAEEVKDDLATWREALEDFRRGLLDRDELLDKTVGYG